MLKSAKMEQINIVVLDKDIDVVTEEIINLRLLHLVEINSLLRSSVNNFPCLKHKSLVF